MYKVAGVLTSTPFVYLAVREVDFSESVRVLGTLRFEWLAAAVMVYLYGQGRRTLLPVRNSVNPEAGDTRLPKRSATKLLYYGSTLL